MTPHASKPMRILFVTTSMPVGGAETLLASLVRRFDRNRFAPEIVCLKDRGPLGEELARELPVHANLLSHKFDARVLPRLWRLMRSPRTDAVVTVGAGDKMFWGRIVGRLAGVPVVASALHSTGWPDGVGRLNRLLTRWTDAFIGVADAHGRHLVENEGFPDKKVHVIYNGVDCDRFSPRDGAPTRKSLGIALQDPVVGILAALRPEKNHEMFLAGAQEVLAALPAAKFLIVGDGERRAALQALAQHLGLASAVRFLGTRSDVPEVLAACDVSVLTSHNEASPVSVLEALSVGRPVIASDVGSVRETVIDGETGRLFAPGDLGAYASAVVELLLDPEKRKRMGVAGRRLVVQGRSLDVMVRSYETLIEQLFQARSDCRNGASSSTVARTWNWGPSRRLPG